MWNSFQDANVCSLNIFVQCSSYIYFHLCKYFIVLNKRFKKNEWMVVSEGMTLKGHMRVYVGRWFRLVWS